MRVPWIARRFNQSVLKEINLEYSLEGLMLNLKLHCFGYLMRRANSLEKTLLLGKTEGKRRRGRQKKREINSMLICMREKKRKEKMDSSKVHAKRKRKRNMDSS